MDALVDQAHKQGECGLRVVQAKQARRGVDVPAGDGQDAGEHARVGGLDACGVGAADAGQFDLKRQPGRLGLFFHEPGDFFRHDGSGVGQRERHALTQGRDDAVRGNAGGIGRGGVLERKSHVGPGGVGGGLRAQAPRFFLHAEAGHQVDGRRSFTERLEKGDEERAAGTVVERLGGHAPARQFRQGRMGDGGRSAADAQLGHLVRAGASKVYEQFTEVEDAVAFFGPGDVGGEDTDDTEVFRAVRGAHFDPLREEIRADAGAAPCSDAYLRFLVEELKPWVDANLPTLPGSAHTAVMGSSMGGLISLYALCHYPQVFGLAGCLSTHFPIGAGQIEEWMRDNLPQPGSHRLYFDFGGRGGDREYGVHHLRVRSFLDGLGWRDGSDYLIRRFPDATHNERAWRKRLHVPLRFLFAEKR